MWKITYLHRNILCAARTRTRSITVGLAACSPTNDGRGGYALCARRYGAVSSPTNNESGGASVSSRGIHRREYTWESIVEMMRDRNLTLVSTKEQFLAQTDSIKTKFRLLP